MSSIGEKIENNRSDHKMPVYGDLVLDALRKSETPHRSPKGNGSPKITDRSVLTPLGGTQRKDLDIISENELSNLPNTTEGPS
jgi:hypothetical protein